MTMTGTGLQWKSATLPEALERSAKAERGVLVFHMPEGITTLTAADVAREAERRAASLAALGVGRGDRIGVLGPNSPDWALWAWSIWRLGGTLVPLPYPLLGTPDGLAQQIDAMTTALQCRLVLAHPHRLRAVPEKLGRAWDDVPVADAPAPPGPSRDDLAVIQLTSGSTAAPKGAMLSHGSVLAALEISTRATQLQVDRDRLAAWLPFFHDYGLFAFMTRPLVFGLEVHLMSTEQFAQDPAAWWRLLAEVGATFTAGPPSAWAMTARAVEANPDGVDLSKLLGGTMAAETINADTVERVCSVGARFGLGPNVIQSGYGLAEATLGVAGTAIGEGLRIDEISAERFAEAAEAVPASGEGCKRVVSCGQPMEGVELRIIGDERELPERKVGEIQVLSPSLMRGYSGAEAPDPFVDGWLRTGDLGYVADGELFVTGRMKDIIIVMGRNYASEDLEWAAATVPEVKLGRCVAFAKSDSSDGEAIVLVEAAAGADVAKLAHSVRMAVARRVGGVPVEVVVAPRGTVQKTTSGKLKRSATRDAYAAGRVEPLKP